MSEQPVLFPETRTYDVLVLVLVFCLQVLVLVVSVFVRGPRDATHAQPISRLLLANEVRRVRVLRLRVCSLRVVGGQLMKIAWEPT